MKIKYLILTTVLATAVLFSSGVVKAVDNSALIAQLQAQIASLLAQIKVLQGNQGVGNWCYDFNKDLKFGNSAGDVQHLGTALQKEGFNAGAATSEGAGYYFNELTSSAVIMFQKKYGIKTTGFVGPITRAKLNKLYGCKTTPETGCSNLYWFDNTNKTCQTQKQFCGAFVYYGLRTFTTQQACLSAVGASTQPSITVISPNGGEIWKKGETHYIEFSSINLATNDKVNIWLGSDDGGGVLALITENFLASNGRISWTVPTSNVDINQRSHFRVCISSLSNQNIRDCSDNYFTITAQ